MTSFAGDSLAKKHLRAAFELHILTQALLVYANFESYFLVCCVTALTALTLEHTVTLDRSIMPSLKTNTVANMALRGHECLTRGPVAARSRSTAPTQPRRSPASPRPTGLQMRASATHMGPPHYFVWRQQGSVSRLQQQEGALPQSSGRRYSRSFGREASQPRFETTWKQYRRELTAQDKLAESMQEAARAFRDNNNKNRRDLTKQVRWVKRLIVVHIVMSQSLLSIPLWFALLTKLCS